MVGLMKNISYYWVILRLFVKAIFKIMTSLRFQFMTSWYNFLYASSSFLNLLLNSVSPIRFLLFSRSILYSLDHYFQVPLNDMFGYSNELRSMTQVMLKEIGISACWFSFKCLFCLNLA